MSKYMSFDAEAFPNRELLVEALKEIGFENVTVGTDLLLQGYDKRDQRLADVVIRRESVKSHRMLGDIGFQKSAKGYALVVDDMDLDYRLGRDFIKRLQTQYTEATARRMAKKLGGTLVKETVGKTVKIRVRF
ncbi:MAG TPA: DUF1257 domain-containing protein [Pyrinomonadaceae bacterium]|nr:DUF1257 domain-containing protein [Pyrinomonadaceae bacterium]